MFRLDKVLRWKELLERRARAERAEMERRAEELEDAAYGFAETRSSFPDLAPSSGGIDDLVAWTKWGESLRRREWFLQERLRALRPQLEDKRSAHVEIRQEVEGLRRLKERAISARKKAREKRAQEAIDDVTARRKLPGPGRSFPRTPVTTAREEGESAPERPQDGGEGQNRGWGT